MSNVCLFTIRMSESDVSIVHFVLISTSVLAGYDVEAERPVPTSVGTGPLQCFRIRQAFCHSRRQVLWSDGTTVPDIVDIDGTGAAGTRIAPAADADGHRPDPAQVHAG